MTLSSSFLTGYVYHILFWEDHLTALALPVLEMLVPMLIAWLITALKLTIWLLGMVVMLYAGVFSLVFRIFSLVFWILAHAFNLLFDTLWDILISHNSIFE